MRPFSINIPEKSIKNTMNDEECKPMKQIEEIVKSSLEKEVGQHLVKSVNEVDINENLWEIGMDSLAFIRLVVSLEIETDTEFDDEVLTMEKLSSIKDFIDYISSKEIMLANKQE